MNSIVFGLALLFTLFFILLTMLETGERDRNYSAAAIIGIVAVLFWTWYHYLSH